MIPIETEVINSLIISCMSDTLFKIILKESPEFRNKLIALILGMDINIVKEYIVTDSIVNVVNKKQKQAQVDFLLKNGKKYIDLEAYTSYKVSNIIKNYHYACGIFWRANKKGKVYDTNTEIIQIVFNNFNDIGKDIINIEYLPITFAKGFDKKLITIINVNLALLDNIEYTDSELAKYLKFLKSNNLKELEDLSKGDKILKGVLEMIKKYSGKEKYLATYYLEDYQEEMHEMDMQWAKDIGRQEGEVIGKTKTAKAMLKDGMKPSLIAKYTGLSVNTIKSIIL